jgi:hypothetical protein
MSKVLDMAKRLEEAERVIAELQNKDRTASASVPESWSPLTANSQCRRDSSAVEATMTAAQRTEPDSGRSPLVGITSSSVRPQQLTGQPAIATPLPSVQIMSDTTTPKEISAEVSVDERGALCYYGPTSAVHDPLATSAPSPQVPITASEDFLTKARAALVAKAKESRMWEGFAISNATVQSEIPRQVISKLLQLNWTWTSPMFMWVYRPAFMGKLQSNFRSPVLL